MYMYGDMIHCSSVLLHPVYRSMANDNTSDIVDNTSDIWIYLDNIIIIIIIFPTSLLENHIDT